MTMEYGIPLDFSFLVKTLIFTLVKINLYKFIVKYEMNLKWNLYFRRENNGKIWRPVFILQMKIVLFIDMKEPQKHW